ncbi:MAG TPA: ABC transporter permease [Puia sp.]|nr:ABC transporter permease [Puia sp.]
MIRNYILVALRQLKRHKLFSILNIFCLAIGICFCMLIGQYVLHERQVNGTLRNIHGQYLIGSDWKVKNMGMDITTVGPLAKALKDQYPDLVQNYYRFNPITNVVSAGDRHFQENIAIGDTTFVSMYGYSLLYGNPERPFPNNSSAVITGSMATKLFGTANVVGKTITITNTTGTTQDFTVSAVLSEPGYNSVNNLVDKTGYSVFVPFEGNQYYQGGPGQDSWNSAFIAGFISLQPGVQPSQLYGPMKQLLKLNCPENLSKNLEPRLDPIEYYYLRKDNAAVEKTLDILSLVSIGILLMAIINFVNIMIGTAAYRIKEIGLRKVFGGRKGQLVMQYLTESIVLTWLATLLSLLLYTLFRPVFNEVLQTNLPAVTSFTLRQTAYLCLLILTVGFLAGIYPAFVLSASEVVASVKGKINLDEKGSWMRKSLLVLQFAVAIVVFVVALTISRQVNYFFEKDLGYNKGQVIVISAFPKQWDSAGVARMETVRRSLESLSGVKSASVCYEVPERKPPLSLTLTPEGAAATQALVIPTITVDENYAATFGIPMSQGRFFRNGIGGFVPNEMVLSESAVKAFGLKDAIGKKLDLPNGGGQFTIVGITKDFNYSSLHEAIGPLAFLHVRDGQGYRFLSVKLQGGQMDRNIAAVRERWKAMLPASPFQYFFMDEKFQSMYESELHLKKAAVAGTVLMSLIVLLGIFGVLTLSLTKRTKEIAVRKVLGAEIYHIIALFLKQYAVLMFIALGVALPIAYLLSSRWLDQYAYRISQQATQYLLVSFLVCAVSFLLIGVRCLKVALGNPVDSLKNE